MTWLLNLFTTFDGRISRKDWWIGTLVIVAVTFIGQWIMAPSSFEPSDDPAARPSPIQTLLSIIAFVPTLAITFKRLNDRDQPRVLGYLFGVVYVACTVLFQFMPEDWAHLGRQEWAMALPLLLFSFWILIDNGFLKGTQGPNRYGPDPLDPGSGGTSAGAVPRVGRTRYTAGTFLRDATIGAAALIGGAYLLVPQVNMENTVELMVRLTLGKDYEDYQRRKLVDRHLAQFDPESEEEQAELDEQMRAHAQAWQDYDEGWKAAIYDKHAEAVRDFTLAIERYGPENKVSAEIFRRRAGSYEELNEPAKALKDFSIAITLRPDWPEGYASRGNFNMRREHYEKALADFDRAIRLSRVPEAYFQKRRGDVLRRLERPAQALGAYGNAIEKANTRYERLMKIDRNMPDLTKEQRETFEEWASEKRDQSIRRAEIGRGKALRDLGQLDDALAAFNQAVELDPEAAYTYVERGWIHEKMGQLDLAMADYERAREFGNTSGWLKKAIARVKSKLN